MQKLALAFIALLPLASAFAEVASPYPEADKLTVSPGNTIYSVDSDKGDDANPPGKPWKTFGRLNAMKLAAGDTVLIAPGVQEETLKLSGEGTARNPVVIKFLPGLHTISIKKVFRKQLFISNAIDSTDPIPVGIILSQVKHFRVQGGGVEGAGKTTLLYDGRMMQILTENSEDVDYSGLVLDMKRTAVSEFRVLEAQGSMATIQVAEGSDYKVENGKFSWRGDWLGGDLLAQEFELQSGKCKRCGAPRGWTTDGQTVAKATELGDRKIKIEFASGESGIKPGHQYQFRNGKRVMAGVHTTRSARITFRDCEVNALSCMGFVSQFTDGMTIQRVNVVPPANTIRTCSAWADIFQFSNCRGEILVDSCRLSGMQDDALNCHGTYLRIIEKRGEQQLLTRFVHPQTYGFAPYTVGDEIAVMHAKILREYPNNPRAIVSKVERITDKDWLVTIQGTMPTFDKDDVIDNITWNPSLLTIRNCHVSVDPVRGFLLASRGKIVVENNTFDHCGMSAILVEGDAMGWFESSPIRDLLIKNNRFLNCGVSITTSVKAPKTEEPIHENIRILNNDFTGGEIKAKSVKGLRVEGNRSVKSALNVQPDASCTDVVVSGNAVVAE
jgi:hypothetical protein